MSDERQQPGREESDRDANGQRVIEEGSMLGSLGSINLEDGNEVPDFVPTLHELKQLALYWTNEQLEHEFALFAYQQGGSSERRYWNLIDSRLNRLAEILGEEAMQQVDKDAVASYRQRYTTINDEDWRVFTTGTEKEQEAWRTKLWDAMFPGSQRSLRSTQAGSSCAEEDSTGEGDIHEY
jgi:hypothetical protein